jgi:RNA polymerase sigma factor (sigma-70 family)
MSGRTSEAFGVLVDKYREGIYAFVYAKLRDFHDAQDVTQEVFLHAYRNLRTLRRWESFASWLYRIASRRCKLWIRTASRRVDRDFIQDQDPEEMDAPSLASYRESQVDESVQEALSLLPEIHREVLILRYFGGMNSVEIAKAIGVSPGAIRMRLTRAREQLKEEMVAMIGTAFEEQRLPIGFTLRVIQAIKSIKINPMPRMAGLPWGLSLAAGIIITVEEYTPEGWPFQQSVTPQGKLPTKWGQVKSH